MPQPISVTMLDDRICPACKVILREGTDVCVKCGRTVEPATLPSIDRTGKLYSLLIDRLGPVWGRLAFVLLFALFILLVVTMLSR